MLLLKITEEDEEHKPEVTVRLATAKEIGMDAASSESFRRTGWHLCPNDEERRALNSFLGREEGFWFTTGETQASVRFSFFKCFITDSSKLSRFHGITIIALKCVIFKCLGKEQTTFSSNTICYLCFRHDKLSPTTN